MDVGFGRAEAGKGGLEYEECGADEDPDEDEEEALLSEEVVDRSGKRSGMFECFRGVCTGRFVIVVAVIDARLLMELLHVCAWRIEY